MNALPKIILSTFALTLAAAANADQGLISFNGSVAGPTCVINGGNNDLLVNLPQVSTYDLRQAGQTAGEQSFSLVLSQCSHVGQVSTYFEPGPTVNPEGRLTVDGGSGAAGNVDVQLLNSARAPMNLAGARGNQNSQRIDIVNGNAILNYTARYFSLGSTTPGLVSTNVRYSLEYL
ncbi:MULTISPECIES: fimbrial protein [unclassified Pseudomonas]|uniref:fimbrial protein n=1 Tax=unclassified Pseudomonas TaxID=196821 RepID=UPI00244C464A|nr:MULTISPECIES: fimbrial protein [unclassified Pseudomonas]MDH0303431.1 type 1 fimbrial protein [Pseudomonas sp. GD04091]MDH1984502.1 type 1 fimbrial protein [Pseudomonas sp. GD03689]